MLFLFDGHIALVLTIVAVLCWNPLAFPGALALGSAFILGSVLKELLASRAPAEKEAGLLAISTRC